MHQDGPETTNQRSLRGLIEGSPGTAIAVVAVVGVAITLVASWLLWSAERADAARALQTRTEVVAHSIESKISEATIRLASIAGLFQASTEVTELEFRRFVRKMGDMPAVTAIGYMPVIPNRNIHEYESLMRIGNPEFDVYELDPWGRRVPVETRRLHAPLQWYEPETAFPEIEGFDSMSDLRRADAMEVARLTRSLSISPYIRLVSKLDTDGVVMYWPVTDAESEALVGYAVASMDLSEIMDQALSDVASPMLTWHLLDVSHLSEDPRITEPGMYMIETGGRRWQLVIKPLPNSEMDPNPKTAILLMVCGLLATAFVARALSNRIRNRDARREFDKLRELTYAKDQFLASVGHELRTPLTSVLGFAELLRSESDIPEEERNAMISSVADEASDLASIVDDLLVAARSELDLLVVSSVPVSARAQVAQVLEAHRKYDSDSLQVVCDPEHPYRAIGDPSRVRQILRNLITNAYRYGGGSIEVRLSADPEWIRMAVADNGVGVSDEDAESIFTPYYRAHSIESQPAALGIGLSVARQLAVLMGGDLSYRRQDGWTVFELSLPAAPDQSGTRHRPRAVRDPVQVEAGIS